MILNLCLSLVLQYAENRSAPHRHIGMGHYEMPMWGTTFFLVFKKEYIGGKYSEKVVYCADGVLAGVQQTSGCCSSRLSLRDRTK